MKSFDEIAAMAEQAMRDGDPELAAMLHALCAAKAGRCEFQLLEHIGAFLVQQVTDFPGLAAERN